MRIIHIIISLESGGAEGMLERLMRVDSSDCSVLQSIVVLKSDEGSIGRRLRAEGYEVSTCGMESIGSIPYAFYKLFRILKHHRPKAVYTWMYHADVLGGLAAWLCGIKRIIWGVRCTEIPQGSFSSTAILIKIASLLAHYIPTTIACCAESARDAHVKLGYPANKMVVIPNGYNLELFNPSDELRRRVRTQLGVGDDTLLVGLVARFDPLKDLNNFVSAAGHVQRSFINVKFVMVGRGLDSLNVELSTWIKSTPHPECFILMGECDPHDLYSSMDAFCLSSKSEGFPNVVAEAMAMRVPCVVTDSGDARLIVGDSGCVVERMNPNALSAGLLKILRLSAGERRRLGEKARQIVEDRYDIRVVQKKYLTLIDQS